MSLPALFPAVVSLSVGVYIMLLFLFKNRFPLLVKLLLLIVGSLLILVFTELLESQNITLPISIQALSSSIELLIYPALLISAMVITGAPLKSSYWLHALPFMVGFIMLTIIYQSSLGQLMPVVATYKFAVMLVYVGFTLTWAKRPIIDGTNRQHKLQTYFFRFMVLLGILLAAMYLMVMANVWNITPGYTDNWGLVLIAVVLYVLALGLFNVKHLLEPKQTQLSAELSKRLPILLKQMDQLFGVELAHLDPDLDARQVAQKLQLQLKDFSSLLRSQGYKNFNHLLAQQRVRTVVAKINAGEHHHKTLLALAYESGFASKTSFNRQFKTQMGHAPREYVRKMATN